MRKQTTLTVDPILWKIFREEYDGSVSSFLDGCMMSYLSKREIKGVLKNDNNSKDL